VRHVETKFSKPLSRFQDCIILQPDQSQFESAEEVPPNVASEEVWRL
jgi:hypothetical protein